MHVPQRADFLVGGPKLLIKHRPRVIKLFEVVFSWKSGFSWKKRPVYGPSMALMQVETSVRHSVRARQLSTTNWLCNRHCAISRPDGVKLCTVSAIAIQKVTGSNPDFSRSIFYWRPFFIDRVQVRYFAKLTFGQKSGFVFKKMTSGRFSEKKWQRFLLLVGGVRLTHHIKIGK